MKRKNIPLKGINRLLQKDRETGLFTKGALIFSLNTLIRSKKPFSLVITGNFSTDIFQYTDFITQKILNEFSLNLDTLVMSRPKKSSIAFILPGVTQEAALLGVNSLLQALFKEKKIKIDSGIAFFSGKIKKIGTTENKGKELFKIADEALFMATSAENNVPCVKLASKQRMILKSSYFTSYQLYRLTEVATEINCKESAVLREALEDYFEKHDSLNPQTTGLKRMNDLSMAYIKLFINLVDMNSKNSMNSKNPINCKNSINHNKDSINRNIVSSTAAQMAMLKGLNERDVSRVALAGLLHDFMDLKFTPQDLLDASGMFRDLSGLIENGEVPLVARFIEKLMQDANFDEKRGKALDNTLEYFIEHNENKKYDPALKKYDPALLEQIKNIIDESLF